MLKFEKVLCPVDFSEFSAGAYDYAQSLAQHYGAELILEHVVEPLCAAYPYAAFPRSVSTLNTLNSDLRSQGQRELEEFVKAHGRNGNKPALVVLEGHPAGSIISLAEKKSADLILMGTHGWQGLDSFILGSVAEKVMRKTRCPVLVVRKPVHGFIAPPDAHDSVKLRKIIFCTDFSSHSEQALSHALSLALEYAADLTLLDVIEEAHSAEEFQAATDAATRRLESLIPLEASEWCNIKPAVRLGRPYQEIIQLALETKADLIVMGVRGRNALDLRLFGSTTHRVLQLGSCSVMAVHVSAAGSNKQNGKVNEK